MKKDEMTLDQLAIRQILVEACTACRWTSSEENQAFDEGRWVYFEANFEKKVNDLRFLIRYLAGKAVLLIAINKLADGLGVFLEVRCIDHLPDVIELLCMQTDHVDSTNYKDWLKQLVHICPDVWVATGDEDDGKILRLVI